MLYYLSILYCSTRVQVLFTMLFLLLLLGVAEAQNNTPAKCCVARQFEVNMGQVGGQLYNHEGSEDPVLLDTDNVMHYDYYNRTMAFEITSHFPDKADVYSKIVIDFKTRRQYVAMGGKCTTSRTGRYLREPCIPDDAVFLGNSTVGFGTNSIDIITWSYPEPMSGNDIKLAVTSKSCVPLVEAVVGVVNGAPAELAILLTDFKPGVRRSSVYALPPECQTTNDVVEFEDHPAHIQRAIRAMEIFAA